jgi:hypothetical protein
VELDDPVVDGLLFQGAYIFFLPKKLTIIIVDVFVPWRVVQGEQPDDGAG